MNKKILYLAAGIFLAPAVLMPHTYADNQVPVYNAYGDAGADSGNDDAGADVPEQTSTPLTLEQRVNKLEAQMANLQQMDISSQIQHLEQEIQELRGQLQVQSYDLNKLRQQWQNTSAHVPASKPPVSGNNMENIDPVAGQAKTPPVAQALALPDSASTQNNFLQDQNAYEAAYSLIQNKQYDKAVTALNQYLAQYPSGRYAVNAHYWLGELYLLQNKADLAVREFQQVIDKYPGSAKVPDSMLKLGLIYYDNGQLSKAKTQLEQVTRQFPDTAVARLAASRLEDIHKQEGNE